MLVTCAEALKSRNDSENQKECEEESDTGAAPVNCFSFSNTTTSSSSFLKKNACNVPQSVSTKSPPNIKHEVNVAKSILQKCSTISGDNLYDHLSDIIKRVIDERPPNITDFFEEFSRNVREQKFHLPERFPPNSVYEESRFYRMSKKLLDSMKLPNILEVDFDICEEESMETLYPPRRSRATGATGEHSSDTSIMIRRNILPEENVLHLQFYWGLCGFGFHQDEVFELSCSMQRLQQHRSVAKCRFWGRMYGLRASYYVAEVTLTKEEIERRQKKMRDEMQEQLMSFNKSKESELGPIDLNLIPGGVGWEDWPAEDLAKMQPLAAPVPKVNPKQKIDVPPELVGKGLNRYTYFVVTNLTDDWFELPIVTPKQINVSRQIKKFLTGNLEEAIDAYPRFPGKEKHYLRTLIARITAGTYVAPSGYYRKITKKEKRFLEGQAEGEEDDDDDDTDEEEGEEGEEQSIDNDVILFVNEKYKPKTLRKLLNPSFWVHFRPHILNQGGITYFDMKKALKEIEKEMARKLREEQGIEEEDTEDEEEEEVDDELHEEPETGPAIFRACSDDATSEYTMAWTLRMSATHNKCNRLVIMRSNLWPGAYSFCYEKFCDNIYLGWGTKYISRNIPFVHLPMVEDEYPHSEYNYKEASDPTFAMEEAVRLAKLKKLEDEILDGVESNDDGDEDANISSDTDTETEED